jgi:hypothetical protein
VSRIRPDTAAELGQAVRRTVHTHAGRLSGQTASRDRQLLALVADRHPGAVDAFGEAAITALLREPTGGLCAWDAARVLAAAAGQRLSTPTAGLRALLGAQCRRCRHQVQVRRAAAAHAAQAASAGRPEALTAAAQPPSRFAWDSAHEVTITPARAAAGQTLPPFYGSRRVQPRR